MLLKYKYEMIFYFTQRNKNTVNTEIFIPQRSQGAQRAQKNLFLSE